MTVKPILFSGPMVCALWDGRKVQTRRIIKPQPALSFIVPLDEKPGWFGDEEGDVQFNSGYAPGDYLWVKETFCLSGQMEKIPLSEMSHYEPVGYFANNWIRELGADMYDRGRKRPSIFMPRWASRITLRVTDVRMQRLTAIEPSDAEAEGIAEWPRIGDDPMTATWSWAAKEPRFDSPVDAFQFLWDSLNEKRGFGWATTPWVVAITFEVVKQNVDAYLKEMEAAA